MPAPEGPPDDARDAVDGPADSAVIGQERLAMLEAVAGGGALVAELVQLFVHDVPPLLDLVRDAARTEDADGLRRSAHALKGSASALGADRMSGLCRQLEALARMRDWPRSGAAVASLEAEFERVKQALTEWLAAR